MSEYGIHTNTEYKIQLYNPPLICFSLGLSYSTLLKNHRRLSNIQQKVKTQKTALKIV